MFDTNPQPCVMPFGNQFDSLSSDHELLANMQADFARQEREQAERMQCMEQRRLEFQQNHEQFVRDADALQTRSNAAFDKIGALAEKHEQEKEHDRKVMKRVLIGLGIALAAPILVLVGIAAYTTTLDD